MSRVDEKVAMTGDRGNSNGTAGAGRGYSSALADAQVLIWMVSDLGKVISTTAGGGRGCNSAPAELRVLIGGGGGLFYDLGTAGANIGGE